MLKIKYSFILLLISAVVLSAQPHRTLEYSKYSDKAAVNDIRNELADSMFNFVRDELTFMDFEDCNNCDARAHLTCYILEKKFNVNVTKVWLFADYKRASQAQKYKYKPDNYLTFGDDCTRWGYHAAPVIMVKDKGAVDTIVIDPSTQSSPALLKNWALNVIRPNGKGYLVIKDKKYYSFPDDENGRFEDLKKEWVDDENKQLYDDDCSVSIDRILTEKYGYRDHPSYRYWQNEIQDMLNQEN